MERAKITFMVSVEVNGNSIDSAIENFENANIFNDDARSKYNLEVAGIKTIEDAETNDVIAEY